MDHQTTWLFHLPSDKPDDNNDILTPHHLHVHFLRDCAIPLGVNLKRQRRGIKIMPYKRDVSGSFDFFTGPGLLTSFYFSCGPLAGLGFWVNNVPGFIFALAGTTMLWLLIALLKDVSLEVQR
jgi:hypothetical protein